MKILYFILPLFLIAGCWSDIYHDYDHEIRCRKYTDIPNAISNCIYEVESHGFYVTKVSVQEFLGIYKINVYGVNRQRYIEKNISLQNDK